MLRHETFLLKVCKNPDVKCAVVEHAHRMIRDRLYNYFTYKNTYRYINVPWKFFKTYNDTVQLTTGMAPTRVTDADVLAIWRRMEAKRQSVRVVMDKFRNGQHVRIRKEKMKFAKVSEHNFITEIFRIIKAIHKRPRRIYNLEDLHGTPIDSQFYQEELTPVRFTCRTNYKIYKILDNRV